MGFEVANHFNYKIVFIFTAVIAAAPARSKDMGCTASPERVIRFICHTTRQPAGEEPL